MLLRAAYVPGSIGGVTGPEQPRLPAAFRGGGVVDRCRQLRLPLMVSETNEQQATNFTLSIEAAEGVTTGISAHDRAHTIQTAVKNGARPEDLRQPGHIFPLMAQPGGVMSRAGHTEAGCDLARLAGFSAASVLVEIMNADGTNLRAVYTCGGGARIPGLTQALGDRLRLPVEIANPLANLKVRDGAFASLVTDEVAPLLMLPIGLALRKVA